MDQPTNQPTTIIIINHVYTGKVLQQTEFAAINQGPVNLVSWGVHNILLVEVCAAHMGGFLAFKFSKQGYHFHEISHVGGWVIG